MKAKLIKVIIGIFAVVPIVVSSCMMNDSDDLPDFNEQLQKDLAAIDSYLATNNIVAQQDDRGLIRYVILLDAVDGDKAGLDSCATANYSGKLMSNGYEFDKGTNFSFPVDAVIDGWKIAIPLLNEGDSAALYIPSGLAYGFYGNKPEIPSNANLIFNVGIKKVGSTYRSSNGGSCD